MPYNILFPFRMNFSSYPPPAHAQLARLLSLRESSSLRSNPNLCTSVFPILSLLYFWLPLSLIVTVHYTTLLNHLKTCKYLLRGKKWLNKAIIQSKGRSKAKNTHMLINIFLSYKSYRNITIAPCIALYVVKVSKNVFILKVNSNNFYKINLLDQNKHYILMN